MPSGSKLVVSDAWTQMSMGLGEQELVWREMIEPAGWQGKFVGRWAGTVAGAS
jgi:hypothetical protein